MAAIRLLKWNIISQCKRSYSAVSSIAKNVQSQNISELNQFDYFGVRNMFDVKTLFQNRVHLGHKSLLRNPHMRPFLFGTRLGVDIIDLNKTSVLLGDALNFTAHIANRKGMIMLVTRVPQNIQFVEKVALECGEYSHCRRWKAGTFTNSTQRFGAMTRLPDLVIFISTSGDALEEHDGVVECAKLNIPTIGILDSNRDPRLITYPVPGNGDSPASAEFFASLFGKAIMIGKNAQNN